MSTALGGLLPDTKVYVAWGSTRDSDLTVATWTEITASLEADSFVTIGRGKGDEDSDPQETSIGFMLDNRTGDYTPNHQPAANWPNVVRGVPVKVVTSWGVNLIGNGGYETDLAGHTGVAFGWDLAVATRTAHSTADAGYLQAMGGWCQTLTFPADSGNHNAGDLYLVSGLSIGQTYTLSAYGFSATTQPNFGLVAYGVSAGSLVTTKDQWVRPSHTFVATGTSHYVGVYASSYSVGKVIRVDNMQLEVGSAASLYTNIPPTDFVDATAFVDDWLPAWPGQGEEYSVVQVLALGRLKDAAGAEPLPTRVGCALTRDTDVTAAANITHYYPMNDETGSGELLDASGNARAPVPVGWSLATTGTGVLPVGFEAAPVPNVITRRAVAPLAGHSVANAGVVGSGSAFALWFRTSTGLPTGGSAVQVYICGINDELGNTHWVGISSDVSSLPNIVENSNNTPTGGIQEYGISSSATNYGDGLWHFIVVTIEDAGANIIVTAWIDGVSIGFDSMTSAPASVPAFTSAILAQDYGQIENLAHFAVWDAPDIDASLLLVASAGSSFDPVADRIDDLARWGLNLDVDHVGTTDTYVAGQATLGQAPLDLLRTVARSDHGQLQEAKDGDLQFVTGNSRYNLPVYMTLDLDLGQVSGLTPATDDRRLINVAQVTGPTSVARSENNQSVAGYGAYSADQEVVTAGSWSTARESGDLVQRHADWLANTRAEVVEGRLDPRTRFPQIDIDLGNVPELIEAWLTGDPLGKRTQVVNPPSQILGPRDVIIEGYTEERGATTFRVSANVSPYQPVWVIDDPVLGAVAPVGHVLDANITFNATSMTVVVPTASTAWITTGPFPDLDVFGEAIGVTAITALAAGKQTFTIVRGKYGTTGRAHSAGDVVQLWSKHVIAL